MTVLLSADVSLWVWLVTLGVIMLASTSGVQGEVIYKRGIPVGIVRQFIYGYSVDRNIGFGIVDAAKAPVGTRVTIGVNASPAVVVESKWL